MATLRLFRLPSHVSEASIRLESDHATMKGSALVRLCVWLISGSMRSMCVCPGYSIHTGLDFDLMESTPVSSHDSFYRHSRGGILRFTVQGCRPEVSVT